MKKINYLFHLSFNGYKFEQDNILFIDEHVALNSFKTSGDDRRSFASASFFIIFCFKFICILLYLTYSCVINMKKMNELKKAELSSAFQFLSPLSFFAAMLLLFVADMSVLILNFASSQSGKDLARTRYLSMKDSGIDRCFCCYN